MSDKKGEDQSLENSAVQTREEPLEGETESVENPVSAEILPDSEQVLAESGEELSAEHDASEQVETAPEKNKENKRPFPWGRLMLFLLLLLTMGAVAFLGWRGYEFLGLDEKKIQQIKELRAQQQGLLGQMSAMQQQLQQQQQGLASSLQSEQKLAQRIQALEQRVLAQNKRLLAMSTVTREDWLLAEAEYLLKLANQRVLIERSAEGAESLLSEADNILRDLDDPDLFSLREAISNDLAALRLTKKIDVTGLYLDINGLINQISSLPLQPTRQQIMAIEAAPQTEKHSEESAGLWQKILASFKGFIAGLKEYVDYKDHSTQPKAVLTPEAELYLEQNIRLMLERAQLALLREQQQVFEQSLQQASDYVEQFYPHSDHSVLFAEQLQRIKQRKVVVALPDITASLELLRAYIEQLHQLKGAQPAQGSN